MAKPRDSSSTYPVVESEEYEEETSEAESESEPEPPQVNMKSTPAPVSKKPEPQPSKIQSAGSSSEDDDGGSDSETNSDSPIKKPDSAVKSMDDTPRNSNPENSRYKSNASGTVTTAGAKRPSITSTAREPKRLKQKSETEVEVKLFQRLWSEDDEIAVLQGMIDYRAKKKVDPIADLNDFHEFIKKLIHIDVSKTQLQDKIRRLKKKYKNNSSKEAEGKYRVSLKAHDQTAYELSKKVWGEVGNALSPKPNGAAVKGSKNTTSVVAETKVNEMVLGGVKREEGIKDIHIDLGDQRFDGWIAEESWKMMAGEKREEMEEKWKKLRQKEVEVCVARLELKLEHAKIVLKALK